MLIDYSAAGPQPASETQPPGSRSAPRWRETPVWNRFTPMQLLVMGLATIAPLVILVTLAGAAVGALSSETARDIALGAGEDPGVLIFGAMFLASPMQWRTGRSQVRVRKYLGIVFFLLAVSNGAMFVWEEGLGQLASSAMVLAGAVALLLAAPLFVTSSRASQRLMGMRRWRLLHKLTYVVAVVLVVHLVLTPEGGGPGLILILAGFACRIPAVRRRLGRRHHDQRLG